MGGRYVARTRKRPLVSAICLLVSAICPLVSATAEGRPRRVLEARRAGEELQGVRAATDGERHEGQGGERPAGGAEARVVVEDQDGHTVGRRWGVRGAGAPGRPGAS